MVRFVPTALKQPLSRLLPEAYVVRPHLFVYPFSKIIAESMQYVKRTQSARIRKSSGTFRSVSSLTDMRTSSLK